MAAAEPLRTPAGGVDECGTVVGRWTAQRGSPAT